MTNYANVKVAMDLRADFAQADIFADIADHDIEFAMWDEMNTLYIAAADKLGIELEITQDAQTLWESTKGLTEEQEDLRLAAYQSIHDEVGIEAIEDVIAKFQTIERKSC